MAADSDILIAGGGIAGSALALALTQAGFSVVLCDGQSEERRAAPAPPVLEVMHLRGRWGHVQE